MKKGIDVSYHQGTIDWEAVKGAGIEFAVLRAGYGDNNIDKQFVRNISECNRLGIPCGIYWFSYALTAAEAAKEAEYCLAAIAPYRVEYPVCFDLEYDTINYAKKQGVTIGKALATQMVHAFCGAVEKAGYYAMNYSNLDYINNMFETDLHKRFDLWFARYNNTCGIDGVGIWQYTSSGSVAGVSGNVDMNYAYKDYPELIRSYGLNHLSKNRYSYDDTVEQMIKDGVTTVENMAYWEGVLRGEEAPKPEYLRAIVERYHEKLS